MYPGKKNYCEVIGPSLLVQAKKSSLFSRNRPGEKVFVTHPPSESNVYQNIYFHFQIINKQAKKKKKNTKRARDNTKENRISLKNGLRNLDLRPPG